MAIAYDASSKGYAVALNSGSFSHTCSGSNRYLFVTASSFCNTVSYNGVDMTLLTTYTPPSYGGNSAPDISVWGLTNPDTGTHTVALYNSSSGDSSIIEAISYTGVDPTQPDAYNTAESGISLQTSLTNSINTITDLSWLVSFVSCLGGSFTLVAGSGTTLRQEDSISSIRRAVYDSNGAKTPTGNYSLIANITTSQTRLSGIIYALKPYQQITLTGPSSGNVNSASTNFTVTPDVAINGTVTITPSGGGLSTPITLTFSNSSTPQTFTITPTNSGTVTLTLTNAVGLNNSSPLSYTANAVVPVAPTIGTATPLNASASVAFTPNSDGGSAITGYTATSTPGSFTGTSTSSPITVSGLSNGTGYAFVVKATNAIGDSSNSSASNSVTPYVPASSFTFTGPSSGNVRSASTNFTVTPNSTYNGTITITPTGVGSTGLSPVILTWNLSSAAQTFTITPLTSGAITLTPTNSNGITNPANLTYTANAVVPLAPTIGLAMPGLSTASVSFTAPSNDGGSNITLYTVTSSPDGKTATTNTPGNVTILGLTNGTSYTFSVTATNSVGTSASSSASNAVIPSASSTSFTNSGPDFNITTGVGNILSL